MAKVNAAAIAALKALYETNDLLTQDNFATFIDMLADAAEDHEHTPSGGPASGTGDAAAVTNLQSGTAAQKPATPAVGDIYIETDTSTVYACYTAENWTALGGGAIPEHGAAKHTDITRELFIPAVGYTDTMHYFLGCKPTIMLVPDQLTSAYSSFKVPVDFVSFTSVKAIWTCSPHPADMCWRLSADYAAAGEHHLQHEDTPAFGTTATGGSAYLNVQEPYNPLTLSSLALGDYVGIRLERDAEDFSDTIYELAIFVGLLFTYTANQ